MNLSNGQLLLAGWLGSMNLLSFLTFGYDKWQAGRKGGRVAEATLCWISALGGWPGGLLAILIFRHKSAKGSFQLKFALAFVGWVALLYAVWRWAPLGWIRRDLTAGIERSAEESRQLPAIHGASKLAGPPEEPMPCG
jgi:uncharacterized membrane protein YsdA (DUF1294 family)